MKYQVEVRDQYGRLVTVINRPQNKSLSLYRNKAGSFQFTMDLLDPQATSNILKVNQYDILVKRMGTPFFGGQISYLNSSIDGDSKQVQVNATGWFDLLDYRYITSDYPNYDYAHNTLPYVSTDTSTIFWSLIENTQFPLTNDSYVLLDGGGNTYDQSFIAQGDGGVVEMRLLLQKVGSATGNLVTEIYDDLNDKPNNLIVSSQVTTACSGISTDLSWLLINYAPYAPALTNGVKYWLRTYLDTSQSPAVGVNWYYLNNNFYVIGRAYCDQNPSLFTASQDFQFFILLDDNSYQMTKNSYLGFIQGNLPTSFNLAPSYAQYKKIKQCLEELSTTLNGIDFSIYPTIDPVTNYMTRTVTTYYPKQGIINTGLNFSYPGNIIRITKPRDSKTMENEVVVRGGGSGQDQVIANSYDTGSILSYGLKQEVENQPDIYDTAVLQSIGDEYIRIRKDPLDLPTISLDGTMLPTVGSYWIGDTIKISFTGIPLINLNSTYRIEEIKITIDDDDMEKIDLTLSNI